MDVCIEGELTIPATKVLEAGKLLLEAISEKAELVPACIPPKYVKQIETPKGILELLEESFERFEVVLETNGSLTFSMEDCCRHEEYDQWIFEALAPVIDDGEFCMSGDEYQWKWMIEGGELSESSGEMIFDHDSKAVPLIEELVALVYPEHLKGLPFAADPDHRDSCDCQSYSQTAYSDLVDRIENLLRVTGYGPQAGKTELDRLAEV